MNFGPLRRRLVGLFVRWGLLKHPYGREYAREQYTLTGRRVSAVEAESTERRQSTAPPYRAALVGLALLLLSFTAAGVLFVSV